MAEPLHALTTSAAKVLGQIVEKHRSRLPDVGRRTRRVPDDVGAQFRRVYISQDSNIHDGTGDPVPVYNSMAGGPEPFICKPNRDLTGDDIEVYWYYPVGVWFTGQAIITQRLKAFATEDVRVQVADAGCSLWHGVAADGNITSGAGYVLLPYWRVAPGTLGGTIDFCRVEVTAGDASFNIEDGDLCDVAFDQATGTFIVTRAYCPGA